MTRRRCTLRANSCPRLRCCFQSVAVVVEGHSNPAGAKHGRFPADALLESIDAVIHIRGCCQVAGCLVDVLGTFAALILAQAPPSFSHLACLCYLFPDEQRYIDSERTESPDLDKSRANERGAMLLRFAVARQQLVRESGRRCQHRRVVGRFPACDT